MAEYSNDVYLRSLAASSGDVDRQVKNALTEVSRQRQVAGAQTSLIPGAVNPIVDGSRQRLSADIASLGTGIHDDGRRGGALQVGAVNQAFDNTKASYGRISGLLNQGFAERQTRQEGGVRGIEQDLLAGLRERAAEYTAGREAEDRQTSFTAQQNAAARALQEEQFNRQIAIDEANRQAEIDAANQEAWKEAIAEAMMAEALADTMIPPGYADYLAMKDKQNA